LTAAMTSMGALAQICARLSGCRRAVQLPCWRTSCRSVLRQRPALRVRNLGLACPNSTTRCSRVRTFQEKIFQREPSLSCLQRRTATKASKLAIN
jgi:hypothetical protein